uniref:mannose-1-phosphate guanylyltransferase n=1 Tax=Magnetococcus massalia (strain MO-1) TaxID=451514 RepID=A0A1S7LM13_MAGMO|nr:mannose-1-phosphate guanyltransferase [Candidatus Magnetococcus massalia]
MLIPTILAGGGGTRLWPLSRDLYPKQFHSGLGDDRPLLQQTLTRCDGLPDLSAPVIICNDQHRFLVREMLAAVALEEGGIYLEPAGRNTAPAAAIAALHAMQQDAEALVLLMPSDHLIANPEKFRQTVEKGIPWAEKGEMVTFGITPSRPHTGFGYICGGEALEPGVMRVDSFKEKPDEATAQSYLDAGNYSWNSGIFLFKAKRFMQILGQLEPKMHSSVSHAFAEVTSQFGFHNLGDPFLEVPADSIDYAVMEKHDGVVVIPMEAGWNDMGAWSALWEVGDKDDDNNVVVGDTVLKETHNSLVYATDRLVTTVGVDNLAIVETADAVLVANKDRVEEVKQVVSHLKATKRSECISHNTVYRPWGTFTLIDEGPRHQVKRIMVKPGARLSLQMHYHRSEHWVVVRGTAEIQKGEERFILKENESTYIPLGQTHSLGNPGKIPLEIIEVQSGPYLGEDDIVRFEDIYARVESPGIEEEQK